MSHQTRVREHVRRRAASESDRNAQVSAMYPHVRTFHLVTAHPVGHTDDSAAGVAHVPRTITLVTPDHDDPSKDHLFIGSHPVLSRDYRYDTGFRELHFSTGDGTDPVRGSLRLTHSRTKAYGPLHYAGHTYAVEYEVKPQRYRMKLGKDAAYVAGSSSAPVIRWDVDSPRWKDAPWTDSFEVGFTYGVVGEEIIGGEIIYTFMAAFDDITTGNTWEPTELDYGGYLNSRRQLRFGVLAGVTPPSSGEPGGSLFPYVLSADLSEFAYDFVGGMLCDRPDVTGTCYGIQGEWVQAQAGGFYHLHTEGNGRHVVVGVHDGRLHVGDTVVSRSALEGRVLRWERLPREITEATGLPGSGHLEFSQDGARVVGSSIGVTGQRVHPDTVAEVARHLAGAPDHAAALEAAGTARADGDHTLAALLSMSQYVRDEKGNFYDQFQADSMEDFYDILQNRMNPEYRKQFFNPNPPPLSPGVYGISTVWGTRGTDPKEWYYNLSTAYTSAALSRWNSEAGAKLLNGRRADLWLSNQTTISDVMQAQAPLLYARRYGMKYANLDWFLTDQRDNWAKYEPIIDGQVQAWIDEIKANTSGTPDQIDKLVEQITAIGARAKKSKQYWAFVVYTYTTKPSYLNMLQTIIRGGDEIDGSEFTQRVQRTAALLNVLDTSNFFAQQYGYLLQLFQLASVLPQFMDYSQEIDDFSFAVKQIIDQFIKDYIESPDPNMRKAAEELRDNASQDLCAQVLQILRQSGAAMGGLYNWTNLAMEFERTCAKLLSKVPALVTKLIAVSAAALLLQFFLTGQVRWSALTKQQQAQIIMTGAGVIAQFALAMLQRGIAFSVVFVPGSGIWNTFKLFFSSSLIAKAQGAASSTFKSWLLNNRTVLQKAEEDGMAMRALFAENAAEAATLYSRSSRLNTMGKIFGRNLGEFVATRIGAAMAVVGMVVSAIMIYESSEPMEYAANSLFLFASVMEFIATAGLWACQALEITMLLGMEVGSLFAMAAMLAWPALVAGVVLMCILMFRTKEGPVEKFAKNDAGPFYMPQKTDIDYFQEYQVGGSPQRSGVAITPNGNSGYALYVTADGSLRQQKFDASGHCSFYLRTDEFGRAQIGAPVTDSEGRQTFYVLALDDDGGLVAQTAVERTTTDERMMWRAEIDGEGHYDIDPVTGDEYLRWANFRLYNEYWHKEHSVRRYVSTDGSTFWKATDGSGTLLQIEMVTTAPGELRMSDISWHTYDHDQRQGPALGMPGSGPRTWSLSPELPAGLIFSADTGVVAMETGVDMKPVEKRTYHLKVSNAAGSAGTDFSIEIKAATAAETVPRRPSAPLGVPATGHDLPRSYASAAAGMDDAAGMDATDGQLTGSRTYHLAVPTSDGSADADLWLEIKAAVVEEVVSRRRSARPGAPAGGPGSSRNGS